MDSKIFLGIDVSKGYADFILIDSKEQVLEDNFRLVDNAQGHKKIIELIKLWKTQGAKEIFCGVESTGGYENNWYALLKGIQSQGVVYAARLNPRVVKAVSDAILRRTITDSVSAENIALYLVKFPERVDYGLNYIRCEDFKDGRIHLTGIQMHIKQRSQLLNQLDKWLYSSFPEALAYCKGHISNWLLRMLVDYPTPQKVRNARNGLSKIKGITALKADSLKSLAVQNEKSVSPQIAHLISVTAKEILHKTELIKSEEAYLSDLYKDNEQVKLLLSIPGVGLASAVKFVLEVEDVNRFESVKKMTAYFGLHPTFKQSGDGKWGSHMSKKGRGTIRAALYMCSLTGVRCNKVLKPIYQRYRSAGMEHYQAIGVVMHKLLRIIYGIMKSQKPFDENIDMANQQNAEQKRIQEQEKLKQQAKEAKRKVYRYQKLEVAGPISNRKATKIKKQMASQTSKKEESTGLPSDLTKV